MFAVHNFEKSRNIHSKIVCGVTLSQHRLHSINKFYKEFAIRCMSKKEAKLRGLCAVKNCIFSLIRRFLMFQRVSPVAFQVISDKSS